MIQITVDSLRFGALVVRSTPWDAYEVVRLTSPCSGTAIARVELLKSASPELRVTMTEPTERFFHSEGMASIERVSLGKWADEAAVDFELVVRGAEDFVEFHLHGHRNYHLFGWRVEFELVNDQVLTRGPKLASEPGS